MFVLFRGYICGKFIPQAKFFCTNNGNLNKKWFFYRNLMKQKTRFFNNSVKPEMEINESTRHSRSYEPFEKMLENRRLQAKRSILVQVHSEQSCKQLYEYCLQFGLVKNMIHYSLYSNLHFVIVEFDNENIVRDVIFKSGYMENTQIIPVRSQFLWFKANDHGKRKKENEIELENVPFSTFGSVVKPKFDEINTWLLTCKDISYQMSLLSQAMHLDDLGTRMRFITALQIENTLSGMFPLIRAIPFGSTVNGFGKVGCDLDVLVHLDNQLDSSTNDNRLIFQTKTSLVNNRSQQQRYIESIADLIERYSPGCKSVKRILQARVPILKFKHEYTGVECDLSLSNLTGVYMSELLNMYASFDERVRPLVYTIRYWAEVVNLTNPAPGRWITNFSLTLLTLFYLQNVKIIPTFNELIKLSRQEDRRFADDVNCTFLRDITPLLNNEITNKSTLAELLKGFFDFYTIFDFDSHAISLRTGKVMPKQEYSALYIVNPLESHLNVSKNVSPEELGRIRIEICNAARHLDRELRLNENSLQSEDEDWGLVSLLHSSQYNSKGRDVFYSAVQKKSPSMSTTRLVAVTDLFEEENDNVEDTKKTDVVNNKKDIDKDSRKHNESNIFHIKTTRKR